MKKIRSLVLIVLSAMLIFTACGKKDTDDTITDADEYVNKIVDSTVIKDFASEVEAAAQKLAPAVETALKNGTIDQARYDEFKGYVDRLAEIKNSGEAEKEELVSIKSELAAIASQAAASNDIIDSLVSPDDKLDSIGSNEEKPVTEEVPTELKDAILKFSSDYISLQNETSRRVDLGEVSQEDYTRLIEAGIAIAELKDMADSGKITADAQSSLEAVRAEVKSIAEKIGSELAGNF